MHGIRGVSAYRTSRMSDTHLRTRGCKAEPLLDFLKYTRSGKFYLVCPVAEEKNIAAFLDTPLVDAKHVVGDGLLSFRRI